MKNSNLIEHFRNLILEIEISSIKDQDNEFLEELRKLTGFNSVEEMIERFKKLAGIE